MANGDLRLFKIFIADEGNIVTLKLRRDLIGILPSAVSVSPTIGDVKVNTISVIRGFLADRKGN